MPHETRHNTVVIVPLQSGLGTVPAQATLKDQLLLPSTRFEPVLFCIWAGSRTISQHINHVIFGAHVQPHAPWLGLAHQLTVQAAGGVGTAHISALLVIVGLNVATISFGGARDDYSFATVSEKDLGCAQYQKLAARETSTRLEPTNRPLRYHNSQS